MPIANEEHDSASTSISQLLRFNVEPTQASSTGTFDTNASFAIPLRNNLGKATETCITDQGEKSINDASELLQNNVMLTKLGGVDMKAKEVKYHHSCRRSYIHLCKAAVKKNDFGIISSKMVAHKAAFQELQKHFDATLVANEGAEYLLSLHMRYLALLRDDDSSYPARSLAHKIKKAYPSELSSHCIS